MNFLVVANLSADKILTKLKPLNELAFVENIYLLRDNDINISLNKVSLVKFTRSKGQIRQIFKIIAGIKFLISNNVDVIISYNMTPHGYLAGFFSVIFKIKWVHCIVAGHREIWKNGKIIEALAIYLLQQASIIVTMGSNTKNYLIDHGIRSKSISVIPNAIDDNEFYPDENIRKRYDIVSLGRIDKNKNLKLIVLAVERLRQNKPDIRVAIGGTGQSMNYLNRLVNDLSLNTNITLLGDISVSDRRDFYNRGKLFVITSLSEGLPMSLLEAMFCGLACVSTDVGEINNVIHDGENGFLLKNPEDIENFVLILNNLIDDRNLYSSVSRKASLITETHSINSVKKLWANCLLNLKSDTPN